MQRWISTWRAVLGAGALACAQLAAAGAFPDRPVKLVVPYTPGGSADQLARALADGMGRELRQPVVVENRPGANTMIAATSVARAPADGYTVLLASNASMVLNPMLYKKVGYDARRDFKVISVAAEIPLVVVTNTQVPAANVREFAGYAKANAGKLNYASVGLGNPLQLATEMLKTELGIDLTHVPYNGSAPALAALLANDVQLMIDVVSTSLPHIKAGKLKALAVTSKERLEVLPDVPTVAESGHPGFQAATWFGLAVPAQTPLEAVARLQAAAARATGDAPFRQTFAALGLVIQRPRDSAEVQRYVDADRARWGSVIQANHIALD
ncbi:Bug family tripartite tricarboxylate transporter substrate binding protein [Cupriavidus basilensis]|uniref:Bug family tripartite tricarboxylate transporter substrate binding protein n=1 Tax=Cupriavidus basilensis TaxID=68895 RepID=UPI0007516F59|nr:tripartite tricarboxylate transporter substrate binding protein [Cupriavidus basilensis]